MTSEVVNERYPRGATSVPSFEANWGWQVLDNVINYRVAECAARTASPDARLRCALRALAALRATSLAGEEHGEFGWENRYARFIGCAFPG
jgi:hypothetical protein